MTKELDAIVAEMRKRADFLAEFRDDYRSAESNKYSEYADRLASLRPVGEAVLVPRTMTDEMEVAFCEVWFSRIRAIDDAGMQDAYNAMLQAAPPGPSAAGGGDAVLREAVESSEALVFGAHGSLAMLPQQTKRWNRAMAAAKDYLATNPQEGRKHG